MIVLGIDPGTRHLGWGVVSRTGTRLTHVAHGVIEPGTKASLGDRLVLIEEKLDEIVRTFKPAAASIEGIFFAKDASAACKLGHARGVALLVCARGGLAIAEYPPARAKRTVTGSGRADKPQVAAMVRAILCLTATPPSDAADALALAITHLQRTPLTPLRPATKGLDRVLIPLRPATNGVEPGLTPLRPATKGIDPIKALLQARKARVNPPARRAVQRP